jgi:membrane-associated phospholipid phosphatase
LPWRYSVDVPFIPSFHPWHLITRLGEAQVLLPAFAVVLVWLVLRLRAPKVALTWLLCVSIATLLTTLSKVAFIGWGIGYAPLDFTGISGHSMFSAAVLPVLAAAAASTSSPRVQRWAPLAGYALAAVIGASRIVVHAHSPSEAFAGFVVGGIASAAAITLAQAPRTHLPKIAMVFFGLWFAGMPAGAPPSPTHSWVTRLSLAVSGHSVPYTRAMMHHRYRLEREAQAAAALTRS